MYCFVIWPRYKESDDQWTQLNREQRKIGQAGLTEENPLSCHVLDFQYISQNANGASEVVGIANAGKRTCCDAPSQLV